MQKSTKLESVEKVFCRHEFIFAPSLDSVTMFCYSILVTKHCYVNCRLKKKMKAKGSDKMDLISKKELLQITGISYGQLYRWKRERLIPEEWFIKQSSFTGQETFFPREMILPRVEAILGNKDKYSLTELSRILSPDIAPALLDAKALEQIEEIAQDLLPAMLHSVQKETYDLFDLALFTSVTRAADQLHITGADERRTLAERAVSVSAQRTVDSLLTVFKVGEYHAILSRADAPFTFDSSITEIVSVSLSECAAMIKMKYRALFPTLE